VRCNIISHMSAIRLEDYRERSMQATQTPGIDSWEISAAMYQANGVLLIGEVQLWLSAGRVS